MTITLNRCEVLVLLASAVAAPGALIKLSTTLCLTCGKNPVVPLGTRGIAFGMKPDDECLHCIAGGIPDDDQFMDFLDHALS